MKFLDLGLLCLLCALSWASEAEEQSQDADELEDNVDFDLLQPWPISSYYIGDSHFVSAIKKSNWFEAIEACNSYGYVLATLPSEVASNTLLNVIKSSGLQSQLTENVWISGSNIANNATWMWYATGNSISYRNIKTTLPKGPRCAAFNPTTGAWTAELCTTKRHFVCQCGTLPVELRQ
ncbi:hypothetical protein ACLKA7_014033 [Drosophila subpalustris]